MIETIVIIAAVILIVSVNLIYAQKGNAWIQDDINKIYTVQKVNRKRLKMELKKLKHQDIYNTFVIYDDLGLKFPEDTDMQKIIDQNRKTDRPITIKWNDYTRSWHITYSDHFRKIINSSK